MAGLIRIGMALLFAGPLALQLCAHASVTLAWDANSETNLAGYRVYYGPSSQSRTNTVDAGNATTVTISNLSPGVTYSFVATAYDIGGLESEPSNEVNHTVPDEPQPLSLIPHEIVIGTNGNAQLGIMGAAGATIVVEGSTNLIQWFPLATNTFTNATLRVAINLQEPRPRFFFRVAYQ